MCKILKLIMSIYHQSTVIIENGIAPNIRTLEINTDSYFLLAAGKPISKDYRYQPFAQVLNADNTQNCKFQVITTQLMRYLDTVNHSFKTYHEYPGFSFI